MNLLSALLLLATVTTAPAQSRDSLLSSARINALPAAQRAQWQQYIATSRSLQQRDAAVVAEEVKGAGLARATPAPTGRGFFVADDKRMTQAWFASQAAREVADLILSYQTPSGGWSKRIDYTHPRQRGESFASEGNENWVPTLDNGSTTEQLGFLAQLLKTHKDAKYVRAFNRGVEYLLVAQMPNGCWPQIYPLRGNYHDAITFNDDVIVHALTVLRGAAGGEPSTVPAAVRTRARAAVSRGVECILATQVDVNGAKTVWGAQHDPFRLQPVKARAYEHASLSGRESAAIIDFLMQLDSPNARIKAAINAGANWFKQSAIHGHSYAPRGRLEVKAGGAPLWARFYEIGSNRPIFSDRDGVIKYDLNEIGEERRTGYLWYTDEPQTTLRRYERWLRAHESQQDAAISAALQRYLAFATQNDPAAGLPRFTDSTGAWQVTRVNEWTSGFFPGGLWLLYGATRDPRLKEQAIRWTLPLGDIPKGSYSHDLGFQFMSSFGWGYRITNDESHRQHALNAARLLAARFNPAVGAIKSWDWMPANRPYPVIVDNMMNLELLFWGARQPGGDPRWKDIAIQHARTTINNHLRADGGSFHVVVFDPANGKVLERITHQGHADSSTWARGQAWLIYGFTMAYRETHEPLFLRTARRVADYFIAHLPADQVPCWDFQAPGCPATAKRDASAAAIAASGLLELSQYVGLADRMRYRAPADRMLSALTQPKYRAAHPRGAVLAHAVGNMPANTEIDVGLSYGDYYLIEALLRQNQLNRTSTFEVLPELPPVQHTHRAELMRNARARLQAGDTVLQPALSQLITEADAALTTGPFTVTSKKRTPPTGDKRDYMSFAPYWWPDSTKKDGLPYIRRDGEVNQELRRDSDVLRWYAMSDAAETLAQAWYFTERPVYAQRAAMLLRTWFVDPGTRMKPNLNYGQAIPGVTEGRGIGIIDTRDLGRVIDTITLLRGSSAWDPSDDRAITSWMRAYLDWLLTSPHGRDEADEANNHGTWYDVQVVSLALFVGDTARARATAEAAKSQRIGKQIDADGKQPLELARTRSLHYSVENLEGFTRLAEVARHAGVDLWNYTAPNGASIRKAIEFVAPYADPGRKWPHPQITAEAEDLFVPLLHRASIAYREPGFAAHLRALPTPIIRAHRMNLLYPLN